MQRKGSLVLHGVKALALAAQAEVKPLEHPTLHAMVILVDDLFGSNQTQSDAIRRNQRSSVVISGPVWIQSDAIRRNQTQSDAITHLFGCIARRRSVAIRRVVISGHQWSSVVISGHSKGPGEGCYKGQKGEGRTCSHASHSASEPGSGYSISST